METCRHYALGRCRYGAACRFAHAIVNAAPDVAALAEQVQGLSLLGPAAARPPVTSWRPPASRGRPPQPGAAGVASSLLYVDALNFADFFFDRVPRDWGLERPERLVRAFVRGASAAGLTLKAFIDMGIDTDEALGKWKKRREKEVRSGSKRVPHGMSVLLGDMLRRAGVEVAYSLETDNDDALAAHAQADGAGVMSGDKDMFRYAGASFSVFSDFDRLQLHATGRFELVPGRPRGDSSVRPLLSPPPASVPADAPAPWVPELLRTRSYMRGVPSPLVKSLGFNPHSRVRPLRVALYRKLFSAAAVSVREVLPEWDAAGACVVWTETDVVFEGGASDTWDALLAGPPRAAFVALFPAESAAAAPPPPGVNKGDWTRHVSACRAVVYELCAAGQSQELLQVLLGP
jgi:hypothetical protein